MRKYDFITDAMLGKLARWLRVLGYSVFYNPKVSDNELLGIACKMGGLLLTRDRELYHKAQEKGIQSIFIPETDIVKILTFLYKKGIIKLRIDFNMTRCPKCNTKLEIVPREVVRGKIPEEVLKRYDIFLQCPNCGSIYWPGKHYTSMIKILNYVKSSSSIE